MDDYFYTMKEIEWIRCFCGNTLTQLDSQEYAYMHIWTHDSLLSFSVSIGLDLDFSHARLSPTTVLSYSSSLCSNFWHSSCAGWTSVCWVVQAGLVRIFCFGSCVSFVSTVLANFLNMLIIQRQNWGVKERKKMMARMKIYKSFYSFKVMYVTLGMSWYSAVLKKRSKGGNRKSKEKGRNSRKVKVGKWQRCFPNDTKARTNYIWAEI